jgi:hypothetical protein
MRATCPANLTLLDLIILIILVKSASYEVPHYVVFSTLILLHPSSVQLFSSIPCSETPSVYVLPIMSETTPRSILAKVQQKDIHILLY